jgi:L-alanine-DL-glutamate epimerase-like enolase superfamily enzyme
MRRPQSVHIARIDVYAVIYRHVGGPFRMSGGRTSDEQQSTVVRIETNEGLAGFGEVCVITPDYAPGWAPATRAVLEPLGRSVLGCDPRQVEVVYARMDAAVRGYREAKSALDMACWDILGQATGLRLVDLLGGAYQERFPLYTGVGLGSPAEMSARCREAVAVGYRRVQVKVGTEPEADIERLEASVEALAEAEVVIVDANAWWTRLDALRVLSAIGRSDILVEQPCPTVAACAAVRRSTGLPVILDESLSTLHDLLDAYAADALDAARFKLSRLGGITPARRVRDLALELDLPLTIEDSGGGDVVSAALAHLACSVPPRLLLAGYLPTEMVAERIAAHTPVAVDGEAALPDGAGLGIEVDVEALGTPLLTLVDG